MSNKKIKRIIAREGLILIGLAVIIYAVLFFLQNIPAALPKYRLEFTNGETHTININPEIRNDNNYKKLLQETYHPSPKLVEKRIKGFIGAENIKSTLKRATCINSTELYISELYSSLIGVTFILKVLITYLALLFIRFIIWAVRTLK
jgi:hypothetical protein